MSVGVWGWLQVGRFQVDGGWMVWDWGRPVAGSRSSSVIVWADAIA